MPRLSDSYYPDIIRSVAADTGLSPAILVCFLVLIFLVILLLVMLILWSLFSRRAVQEEEKRNSLREDSLGIEVMREDGVPPPYSPSIFSTGDVLDGVSSNNGAVTVNGKTLAIVKFRHLSWNSDTWEVNECEEALEVESLNLEIPPLTIHQVPEEKEMKKIGVETIPQDFFSVHETASIYYSCDYLTARSPNVFSDCQAVSGYFLVPGGDGGSSSDISFRSSFSQSSPTVSQDLDLSKIHSPVFRLQLEDKGSPSHLLLKKSDFSLEQRTLGHEKLHFNFNVEEWE